MLRAVKWVEAAEPSQEAGLIWEEEVGGYGPGVGQEDEQIFRGVGTGNK